MGSSILNFPTATPTVNDTNVAPTDESLFANALEASQTPLSEKELKKLWNSEVRQTYKSNDAAAIAGAEFIFEYGSPDTEYGFEMEKTLWGLGDWTVGRFALGDEDSVNASDSLDGVRQLVRNRNSIQTRLHSHPPGTNFDPALSHQDVRMLFKTEAVDGVRTAYLFDHDAGRLYRVEADEQLQPIGLFASKPSELNSETVFQTRNWLTSQITAKTIRVSEVAIIDPQKASTEHNIFGFQIDAEDIDDLGTLDIYAPIKK